MEKGLEFLGIQYGPQKNYLWGIAVAPYINLGSNQDVEGLTVDQVIASLNASIDGYTTGSSLNSAYLTASTNGLHLTAYEGGVDTFSDTAASTAAKAAASNDPRMKDIVTRYLNMWYAKGGELFNWYTLGARTFVSPYATWSITDSYSNLNGPKIQGYVQIGSATPVNLLNGVAYA
jgi:hypothetical protein